MRKRFLSALLALCMALTILPATALAGYYSDLTNQDAQTVFALMENSAAALQAGTPLEIKETVPTEQKDARAKELMDAAQLAVRAFDRDHPDVFWLSGRSAYNAEQSFNSSVADITLKVTLPLAANWADGGRSIATDQITMASAVNAIVTEAKKETSAPDQLRYVHNWLTKNNAYNHAALAENYSETDRTPWTALSALDSALSPVCEGYSRAFKLVCDELAIPCILVSGAASASPSDPSEDHMWNYVQLDGKWYAVDVTWDDPTVNGVDTDGTDTYFLVGSGTENEKGFAFSKGHVLDEEFTYPALNSVSYAETAKEPVTPVITVKDIVAVVGDTLNIEGTASVNGAEVAGKWEFVETAPSAAGTYTVQVKFVPADTSKYTEAVTEITVTINPVEVQLVKPELTVKPNTLSVTAGTTVTTDLFELTAKDGSTDVAGAWAFDGDVDTAEPGRKTIVIRFTPSDPAKYEEAAAEITLTVTPGRVTPEVHANDINVEEGASLEITGTATANGQAVKGSWSFVDAVPGEASVYENVKVKFVPDDTDAYTEAQTVITVTITKADDPAPPVDITDWDFTVSADKTSMKVNETARISVTGADSVGVTLSVDKPELAAIAGGVLTAKKEGIVTVTAAKEGDTTHNATAKTVKVTITKADEPAPPPAEPVEPEVSVRDITVEYGAPVTDSSIKGTATVAGTWAFVGTVPDTIGKHTVTVRFTPENLTAYLPVTRDITLTITKAPVSVSNPSVSGISVGYPVFNTNTYNPCTRENGLWEQNVTVNTNITITLNDLFRQILNTTAWSGDVLFSDGRTRSNSYAFAYVGYWDAATKTLWADKDSRTVVTENVMTGVYLLDPGFDVDKYEALALVVGYPADDSETYYISVPGATGGEIIPNTRYAAYGERVTLNVHPESGYELDSLTVRDIRGRTLALREVGGGKTQYTFTMPSGKVEVKAVFVKKDAGTAPSAPSGVTASPDDEVFTGLGTPGISGIVLNPAPMPFSDVKSSDWYYNYVEYMWKHYLMSGTSDTRFDPDLTTNRAMIWTVLARMNNVRTDINPGSTWYERGMLWAMGQGVTDGTDPMGSITREQLVTMLWRNAGKPGAGSGALSRFSDAASVSGYAETAVRWAVSVGVLTGDNGRINPQGTATRAQVAAMIARYGDKAA